MATAAPGGISPRELGDTQAAEGEFWVSPSAIPSPGRPSARRQGEAWNGQRGWVNPERTGVLLPAWSVWSHTASVCWEGSFSDRL